MIINKLVLGHFGKFHNKEVEFEPGINVIYGKNEAGKSTLHSFIKGMFFGIEKGRGRTAKESLYDRYLPWDAPGTYQGSMEFLKREVPYRISRSFFQKAKSLTMVRTDTGREVLSGEDILLKEFNNFTESNFSNTISIKQTQAETDSELAKEVQNFIANLSTTKSSEVNVSEAVTDLSAKKKELENQLKNNKLEDIEERIKKCIFNEENLDKLYLKKREIVKRLNELKNNYDIEADNEAVLKEEDLPELYEMRGKAKEYKKLEDEAYELSRKKKNIEDDILLIEQHISRHDDIKENLDRAAGILDKQKAVKTEIDIIKGQMEEEFIKDKTNKGRLLSAGIAAGILVIVLTLLAVFVAVIPAAAAVGITAVSVGIIAVAVVQLQRMRKDINLRQKAYEEDLSSKSRKLEELACAYKGILDTYQCREIEDMQYLHSSIAESKAKKAFLLERESEIANEACIRMKKSEELKEELKTGLRKYELRQRINAKAALVYEDDFNEIISRILLNHEMVKKELDIKRAIFKEEYSREEAALAIIDKDIDKIEQKSSSNIKNENIGCNHPNEDNLYELREKYNQEKIKMSHLMRELEAVQLAISTIKRLSEEIHDSFGMELNKTISKLAGEITLSSYTEAAADEKLAVKVFNGMKYIDLNKLSTGTIEQIYLALRLSVAELLFEEDMPLILDDSFANYDDDRLMAVLELIYHMNRQVLLFTCQGREQMLLDKRGIPYHLVHL